MAGSRRRSWPTFLQSKDVQVLISPPLFGWGPTPSLTDARKEDCYLNPVQEAPLTNSGWPLFWRIPMLEERDTAHFLRTLAEAFLNPISETERLQLNLLAWTHLAR